MKTTLTKMIQCAFAALLTSSIFHNAGIADEWTDAFKVRYDFAQWGGETKTNYQHAVTNFSPDFSEIGITNFVFSESEKQGAGYALRYIFSCPNDTNSVIDFRMSSHDSVLRAQESMIEYFSTCSALQPFPPCGTAVLDVGDRCYTGYPTNSLSTVTFVRNTVFICIRAQEAAATNIVISIATWIDNKILNLSM